MHIYIDGYVGGWVRRATKGEKRLRLYGSTRLLGLSASSARGRTSQEEKGKGTAAPGSRRCREGEREKGKADERVDDLGKIKRRAEAEDERPQPPLLSASQDVRHLINYGDGGAVTRACSTWMRRCWTRRRRGASRLRRRQRGFRSCCGVQMGRPSPWPKKKTALSMTPPWPRRRRRRRSLASSDEAEGRSWAPRCPAVVDCGHRSGGYAHCVRARAARTPSQRGRLHALQIGCGNSAADHAGAAAARPAPSRRQDAR